jgi:hypothetical protein
VPVVFSNEEKMTEQLQPNGLTLDDAVWGVLDLPPWDVLDFTRMSCPGKTASDVAAAYTDMIEIGISDRYAQEIDVIKDAIAGLGSLARMQVWHAIGRIAGAI